ncbi:hypothetical protein F5X96DRAFT_690438 [Biscogniauxia mediterranea]|nr:hypothetical protein F5X96DRAFT_690438 [Biscogniauxia mediterranea]
MDIHSRNDTARSAIIIETTCTETLSLSRRLSSVSSVSSVLFMNPTPIIIIIPSSSVPGYVDTDTDTGAETSSSTSSKSAQQASSIEPSQQLSSSTQSQSQDALQQSERGAGSAAHSMGAHVGIGVSVGLAIAAICLAAAWYWRRAWRRRKRKAAVVERPSPVGLIAELDGGWTPPTPQRRRSTLSRSLRDSWYLVLQRNQDEDVPPLPKPPCEVDPEMSFLDLTPSETKSRRSISKTSEL